MADPNRRLPVNAPGDLFVDDSCIDCAACRWMAPETFDAVGETSRVHTQPVEPDARRRAMRALVACPTSSIGTADRAAVAPAIRDFPVQWLDDVFHCGFHHPDSFGATSWLIVRRSGNVLVDSPRFAAPLVRALEALGGVRTLVLTHRDDVADHARYRHHFGCERILHAGDRDAVPDAERVIEGDAVVRLGDDLELVPTPGHTRGSMCLVYQRRVLFSGDHLSWRPSRQHLAGSPGVCWDSWTDQIASARRLRDWPLESVLPGHGWPVSGTAGQVATWLEEGLAWMEAQPGR